MKNLNLSILEGNRFTSSKNNKYAKYVKNVIGSTMFNEQCGHFHEHGEIFFEEKISLNTSYTLVEWTTERDYHYDTHYVQNFMLVSTTNPVELEKVLLDIVNSYDKTTKEQIWEEPKIIGSHMVSKKLTLIEKFKKEVYATDLEIQKSFY